MCSWYYNSDSIFFAFKKYFNSPLIKELTKKKGALIKEQKEFNKRSENIEQDLQIFEFNNFNHKNFLKISLLKMT